MGHIVFTDKTYTATSEMCDPAFGVVVNYHEQKYRLLDLERQSEPGTRLRSLIQKKMTPDTLSKNRIFSGVTLTLYLGVQEVKMELNESLTSINGCHDTYQ